MRIIELHTLELLDFRTGEVITFSMLSISKYLGKLDFVIKTEEGDPFRKLLQEINRERDK